ncbi:hypothetical protein [Brunnivagina elsteri]|nr:hypothetical protein [Calothrix elsteri]
MNIKFMDAIAFAFILVLDWFRLVLHLLSYLAGSYSLCRPTLNNH